MGQTASGPRACKMFKKAPFLSSQPRGSKTRLSTAKPRIACYVPPVVTIVWRAERTGLVLSLAKEE